MIWSAPVAKPILRVIELNGSHASLARKVEYEMLSITAYRVPDRARQVGSSNKATAS